MRENPFRDENEHIKELVKQYEDIKTGRGYTFLDAEAYEVIIDYYHDISDFANATEAADTGILQFPFSAELLIKKADLLIATQQYNDALNLLETASLLNSTDIYLYVLKLDALLYLEEDEKANAVFLEALNLFEGEEKVELLNELTDLFDEHEEFDKLFECLLMILKDDPTNEEALYKICFWTDFTGRNEESIRLHLQIIDEYPYCELAWFNLGAAYQGIKLYEKAVDAYLYALAIDDKFDFAYRNIGDAYIRLRKYKEAIEVLNKVLELSIPEDMIYEALGYCYERLGNYVQARIHYRKASLMSPDDSKLYFKIAATYLEEGVWSFATKELEKALAIHPGFPDYNLAMGECKMELGDIREAIKHLTVFVNARPRSSSGWELLIKCLYRAGYYEEALEQVESARLSTGNKPVFNFYKAGILLAMGQTKQALLVLEAAMAEAPKLLKKLVDLNGTILQHQQVVDVVARFKKGNRFH